MLRESQILHRTMFIAWNKVKSQATHPELLSPIRSLCQLMPTLVCAQSYSVPLSSKAIIPASNSLLLPLTSSLDLRKDRFIYLFRKKNNLPLDRLFFFNLCLENRWWQVQWDFLIKQLEGKGHWRWWKQTGSPRPGFSANQLCTWNKLWTPLNPCFPNSKMGILIAPRLSHCLDKQGSMC